ncbi:hypothetical protein EUGRSUZ_G03220 [Eucalyptus grandis]|uniref:Uncharacterized protein n=2 Tax=Eucalyptus grandis TaxID=71139 RepID=A0ACC3K9D1_EUCGR|nr:hypothetical protein EUGRSUZ_G03220 [Eucalyptus grandis]
MAFQATMNPPGGFTQENSETIKHYTTYTASTIKYPNEYKYFITYNTISYILLLAIILILISGVSLKCRPFTKFATLIMWNAIIFATRLITYQFWY